MLTNNLYQIESVYSLEYIYRILKVVYIISSSLSHDNFENKTSYKRLRLIYCERQTFVYVNIKHRVKILNIAFKREQRLNTMIRECFL